ncbi:hypothetical protein SAMN03080598_04327 [Algoriphagus boritolerans DSM 17298 = JCM 18970]|uniref:Uncharacterized protein n=1 Tax=Algoriphagus boritolerans DSM 17298 = JCM 18970 TaxID=1120964 RepID=A0A1H6AW17_9BACT|nr:hypothetical protein SAMN03080598_04327 [Algoriphagus boritolerans DSM 17298 = JCM 18970]
MEKGGSIGSAGGRLPATTPMSIRVPLGGVAAVVLKIIIGIGDSSNPIFFEIPYE